jgi:hypothetical protein
MMLGNKRAPEDRAEGRTGDHHAPEVLRSTRTLDDMLFEIISL